MLAYRLVQAETRPSRKTLEQLRSPLSPNLCGPISLSPEAATWAGGRFMPLIHIPGQCGQTLHKSSTCLLCLICSYEQYALVHYTGNIQCHLYLQNCHHLGNHDLNDQNHHKSNIFCHLCHQLDNLWAHGQIFHNCNKSLTCVHPYHIPC